MAIHRFTVRVLFPARAAAVATEIQPGLGSMRSKPIAGKSAEVEVAIFVFTILPSFRFSAVLQLSDHMGVTTREAPLFFESVPSRVFSRDHDHRRVKWTFLLFAHL
jgi:hypothetical protein